MYKIKNHNQLNLLLLISFLANEFWLSSRHNEPVGRSFIFHQRARRGLTIHYRGEAPGRNKPTRAEAELGRAEFPDEPRKWISRVDHEPRRAQKGNILPSIATKIMVKWRRQNIILKVARKTLFETSWRKQRLTQLSAPPPRLSRKKSE